MSKEVLEAAATLIGCTIGAGILGIPYVVAKAGFLTGILDIIVLGILIMILNLCTGEIVLRTQEEHQLTGYIGKYLGNTARRIMAFSMIFSIYGAMLAYLIKEGDFLQMLFGGSPFMNSIIFFSIMSLLIYLGLDIIERSEMWIVLLVMLMVGAIIFLTFPHIKTANLTGFNVQSIFIPYGVVLFAFLGNVAIPEMREELKKNRRALKKAIMIGSLVPLIVYVFFALCVVGVTGTATAESAIESLGKFISRSAANFAAFFAVLAMSTAFLALGLALKEMYIFDYKKDRIMAWFLACFVPLLLFLFIKNFINVLAITGAVAGGITGILLILTHMKARKHGDRKPEYAIKLNFLIYLILMLIFTFGIIYQILSEMGLIKI